MTEDEKTVLATALETLGSFEGLDNFEWLNDLKNWLNIIDRPTIISISKNILDNSTLIAHLFTAIKQKQVIKIAYYTFYSKDICYFHKVGTVL